MPFFDPIRIGASGAADTAFTVDRSLRFNRPDNAQLTRTVSSASNRQKWTWSGWAKVTGDTNENFLFGAAPSGANSVDNYGVINFTSNYFQYSIWTGTLRKSTAQFRDPSAWYHLMVVYDSANGTADDRCILYVNGVKITDLATNTTISQNYETAINNNVQHIIGGSGGYTSQANDGYLAEVNFLDGYAYDPSYFGETNALTGQWNPKKYTGSYGTNGFYLNFSDNSSTSALGTDSSGNSNNFTPNNFVTGDAVKDSPTNNFCTFDSLQNYDSLTLSEGNLKATATSTWDMVRSTMGVSSGKWYFEVRCDAAPDNEGWMAGIHETFARDNDGYWIYNGSYTAANYGYAYAVQDNNQRRKNGSSDDTFDTGDIQAGDIVGFRMNLDDNEILISVNGSDKGKMYDIQAGIEYAPFVDLYQGAAASLNCGQDSTFAGATSSGGNTDGGGQGDFKYAVPSGYKALCSANLPDPTILLPNNHFNTLLWSGNGAASRAITGLDFQPDWVWLKSRTNTDYHQAHDAVRGIPAGVLFVNVTAAEDSNYPLDSFDSNGFTTSADASDQQNTNGQNYVAWNWNAGDTDGKTYTVTVVDSGGNKFRFDGFAANAVTLDLAEGGTYIFNYPSGHPFRFSTTADGTHGGGSEYTTGVTHNSSTQVTIVVAASAPQLFYYCSSHSGMGGSVNTNSTSGSSNFDGAIQSVVKTNTTSGFSITTYTGTGSSTTVGHGLGVKPDSIIIKRRDAADNWMFYHKGVNAGVDPEDYYLELNANGAAINSTVMLNDTAPTSTSVTIGSDNSVNGSSATYVMYCFSEVAGYSKFGSYTGNGSSDGTFVFTGFRPAWVMVKKTGSGEGWNIFDNKRDPDNEFGNVIEANSSAAAVTSITNWLDFLSNGIKFRVHYSNTNGSGSTYIYFAFAESPFKNARAR